MNLLKFLRLFKLKSKSRQITLRSCISSDNDFLILPFFLEHYSNLGIKDFRICLNCLNETSAEHLYCLSLLNKFNIKPDIWVGPYSEHIRMNRLNRLVEDLDPADWILTADGDEFQSYGEQGSAFLESLIDSDKNVVKGAIIDKFAESGKVEAFVTTQPIEKQFPLRCNLHRLRETKVCIDYKNECFQPKIALHRKNIILGIGNHVCKTKDGVLEHAFVVEIFHYKWYNNVIQKMKRIHQEDLSAKIPNKSNKEPLMNFINENVSVYERDLVL